jgi:hypothetical protein
MKKTRILNLSLLALLMFMLILFSPTRSATAETNALTGYLNIMGYEGIATLGSNGFVNGPRPPVSDYVTTHCQYINVPLTTVGQYYLRYPLRLPNGSNITRVSMRIADFYTGGSMFAYLRKRPWNSRDSGDTIGFTLTPVGNANDHLIHIENLNIDVNNATTQYWLDLSPQNSADPGQLCVYSIQVTYTIDTSLLPLIQKGY